MWKPVSLKAGDQLVPFRLIKRIDISSIEKAEVEIFTDSETFKAYGFDAIEAVMLFKPSALEGRRLKWKKGAWAVHNIIGHPLMQILAWLGMGKLAVKLHDVTTPSPRDFKAGQ